MNTGPLLSCFSIAAIHCSDSYSYQPVSCVDCQHATYVSRWLYALLAAFNVSFLFVVVSKQQASCSCGSGISLRCQMTQRLWTLWTRSTCVMATHFQQWRSCYRLWQ